MGAKRSSTAERAGRTATYAVVHDLPVRDDRFHFGRTIGTALISLLTALIGTGVVAMINIYARVGTITDSVVRTQSQLDKAGALRRPRRVPSPRPRDSARPRADGDQVRAAGRERYAALDSRLHRAASPIG